MLLRQEPGSACLMEKEVGEPMNMGSVLPVGGAPISDLDHEIEQGLFVFASIDILR